MIRTPLFKHDQSSRGLQCETQLAFIARVLASRDRAIETGQYVDAELVLAKLQRMLCEKGKKSNRTALESDDSPLSAPE